jgi:LPPG:FO 2-phospho-L-lactate transferase
MRSQLLSAGYPLSDVTAALAAHHGVGLTLLPMTDERCETHVVVELDGMRRAIHFQEWWVRYRAKIAATEFVQVGIDAAKPAPAVLEEISEADLLLIAPSNPVVSISTILNIPGLRDAVHNTQAPVVGLSPIVAGAPVRGMADACLPVVNVETSAQGVGSFYGGRSSGGLLDGWLVHSSDAARIDGAEVLARDLMMTDENVTASMVADAVRLMGLT